MTTDQIWRNEEQAVFALRGLYQRYGYAPYKMSQFEEYDLYVRNKDFLISDKIITFSGEGGKLMALKPDVTLSIVKNAPEEPGVVQKVYYSENVYRDYREIMQAGLECVGDLTQYDIAEAVLLAAKSLDLLGGRYVLDISHMGLLAAVLERCGFDEVKQKQAMACLRQKNTHDLKALCGENEEGWQTLQAISACRGGMDALEALLPYLTGEPEQAAVAELKALLEMLKERGYVEGVRLDFSVSNDLGYYSGVVFRGYLEGIPESILSGGQYDKLPRKMGRKSRAIGFAVYADLLQERNREDGAFDVDTLVLHDGTVPLAEVNRAAKAASKNGSVLVATTAPKGRSWKNLVTLKGGAAQ
ncbi:MAG: ATP phosphoribosyltransferase regulatory subunit [Clostridiales bacterium]|nr:ATP phosphoribosyltransferase regulatory subunit [Clostridiales bacterium]